MNKETKSRARRWIEQNRGKWTAMNEESQITSLAELLESSADTGTTGAEGLEPQGGPFSESLKKPSRDRVWIVEQNGRVHSVHSTHESAMKEQGENLRIGAPWQVLPWATPAPVTTPGRDEVKALIKKWRGPSWPGLQSDEVNRERQLVKERCADELEEALAAAKEPRG